MASSEAAETVNKRETAVTKALLGKEETGLTHECGVFGCVATGQWPTQIDVAQVICLGLVALQHRYCSVFIKYTRETPSRTYKARHTVTYPTELLLLLFFL
jgi:transcription initiation factor TFIIIB Brf1 subunit/transcription initiation factor TFIIB